MASVSPLPSLSRYLNYLIKLRCMKRTPTCIETMQMYANHVQMSWLGWTGILHYTSPSLPSQKKKYRSTVVLLSTFRSSHNFGMLFYKKVFDCLTQKSWLNVTFLHFFHSAYEFLGVRITSLVIATSSDHPGKLPLKLNFKLFFFFLKYCILPCFEF